MVSSHTAFHCACVGMSWVCSLPSSVLYIKFWQLLCILHQNTGCFLFVVLAVFSYDLFYFSAHIDCCRILKF